MLRGARNRAYIGSLAIVLAAAPHAATLRSSPLEASVQTQPTPQPFPRPADAAPRPAPPPPPAAPQAPPRPAASTTPAPQGAPTEAMLGVPIAQGAQFIASYDAGMGQRYYLFGATASFAEVVSFYRIALKQRGELAFDIPPTHIFEVGRYREETMAFPPGVTVKDYTSGGSAGYPNAVPGGRPARFPTVIQIVPVTDTGR